MVFLIKRLFAIAQMSVKLIACPERKETQLHKVMLQGKKTGFKIVLHYSLIRGEKKNLRED